MAQDAPFEAVEKACALRRARIHLATGQLCHAFLQQQRLEHVQVLLHCPLDRSPLSALTRSKPNHGWYSVTRNLVGEDRFSESFAQVSDGVLERVADIKAPQSACSFSAPA